MPLLLKLTTAYSENEDRLCLTGRGKEGHVYELWLTRRLADRLFHTIVDWLDKKKAAFVGSDLIQTFEQERAVGSIEPQQQVQASEDVGSSSWLVNNIDIKKDDDAIVMVFKDGGAQEATLAMETIELRQWLSICFKAYRTGEWSLDVWPHWMVHDQAVVPIPDAVQVH